MISVRNLIGFSQLDLESTELPQILNVLLLKACILILFYTQIKTFLTIDSTILD